MVSHFTAIQIKFNDLLETKAGDYQGDCLMPIIECTLLKGYDIETRKLLSQRVTDAACATIGADPELVIITIKEGHGNNYRRGRKNRKPAPPPQHPEKIVKDFLYFMEKRDLEAAESLLNEDFVMTFPSGISFTKMQELVDWSKTRYEAISKTFDGFDTSLQNGSAVVNCFGTLNGTWLDGRKFSGIRFIDRFTIKESKITSQQVWNDLAESKNGL